MAPDAKGRAIVTGSIMLVSSQNAKGQTYIHPLFAEIALRVGACPGPLVNLFLMWQCSVSVQFAEVEESRPETRRKEPLKEPQQPILWLNLMRSLSACALLNGCCSHSRLQGPSLKATGKKV